MSYATSINARVALSKAAQQIAHSNALCAFSQKLQSDDRASAAHKRDMLFECAFNADTRVMQHLVNFTNFDTAIDDALDLAYDVELADRAFMLSRMRVTVERAPRTHH